MPVISGDHDSIEVVASACIEVILYNLDCFFNGQNIFFPPRKTRLIKSGSDIITFSMPQKRKAQRNWGRNN
jgi:hypothetical protein